MISNLLFTNHNKNDFNIPLFNMVEDREHRNTPFILDNKTDKFHKRSEISVSHGEYEDVFWVVAPCSLVEVYERFRGAFCLHHQGTSETSVNFYQTIRRNNPEDSLFIRII
jgi:hypothetical protein